MYYKEGCATLQTKPQKQVLGILGGLGPAASCYLYQMLIDRGQYTIIRTKYNGLYIELKRLRGGTVSAAQKQWIARLRDTGYAVEVCKGWEAAAAVITDYLEGRYKPQYQP